MGYNDMTIGQMLSQHGGTKGHPLGTYLKKVGDLMSFDLDDELAAYSKSLTDKSATSDVVPQEPTHFSPSFKGTDELGQANVILEPAAAPVVPPSESTPTGPMDAQGAMGTMAAIKLLGEMGKAFNPDSPLSRAGTTVGGFAGNMLANKMRQDAIKSLSAGGASPNFQSALLLADMMRSR